MYALSAFLASMAATLAAQAPVPSDQPNEAVLEEGSMDRAMAAWLRLSRAALPRDAAQVRIEQHIILRIAPMPGAARQNLTALAPPPPPPVQMVERRMGDCIAMNAIAGGQPQGRSRLLLFLRDRRMVAANLEKTCSARDFYSGFYVDSPNADGRLCVDRDRILARSGARCRIAGFRQLLERD
ncbi:MAG: hypothetical protein JNJ92_06020 [Altererythrobacter sp.]|nr:hypothetical protein [Altererythrobacter sp.]